MSSVKCSRVIKLLQKKKSYLSNNDNVMFNLYEIQLIWLMFDTNYDIKVAEKFWNFLGGQGAYEELLDCFEQAGIELRPEIDTYFSKFNKI